MSPTLPTLCGSMAARPYRLAVEIHNGAYRELGLDYTFVYFGITDPAAGIEAIRTLGIRGMNVSMPFKSAVIPFLDHIDPAARTIGAVNTIDNRNGVLTGYNTDYIGALRALEEQTDLAGTRVALLGAGGAARAVGYGLADKRALVTVFNRSAESGRLLAQQLDLDFGGSLHRFPGCSEFDIVVNSTSVGFQEPDESPLAEHMFESTLSSNTIVMDVVFLPPRTRLLQLAQASGYRTVEGTRMLLHQACGQVELYTDCRAPIQAMEEVMQREISKMG
ncbi:MAG: shikimate dehydrogenase [Desulfobulbaceae bacterium]|nr:MAG: shikimate dehydrogenase [Desulfobulbaceae bacterium]